MEANTDVCLVGRKINSSWQQRCLRETAATLDIDAITCLPRIVCVELECVRRNPASANLGKLPISLDDLGLELII
jgi:hypothetical protein